MGSCFLIYLLLCVTIWYVPYLYAAGFGRVAGLVSDWELWLMDFRMMFSRLCRFAVLLRQGSDRDWCFGLRLLVRYSIDGCIDGDLGKLETKARLYFWGGWSGICEGFFVLSVVLRRWCCFILYPCTI